VITGFIGYGGGTSLNRAVFGGCAARILIAEDRESMRKALRALFLTRPHWEVCGEAEDGSEAVRKQLNCTPI
jgi:hypothetical protein